MHWEGLAIRGKARYEDGLGRLPDDADGRQKQLVRMAMAAGAVGLARLMAGEPDDAAAWFRRSAERYRQSFADAPPGSWGRLIGAVKARLLAGDYEGAVADARWALEQAPAESGSPIGRYAAVLALLVLSEDREAATLATTLREQSEDGFPAPVADALSALASRDAALYAEALARVLVSFETRESYLEDIPVADTVMVLEALAEPRGLAIRPSSVLLPS